jgi:polysaccharide export outer membrane protein
MSLSPVSRRIATLVEILVLLAVVLLATGCPKQVRAVSLPPAVEATSVGVGDVFIVQIVGEDKLPTEYTVAPDGTVDIPYIHRVTVAGLEPQEISDLIRQRLQSEQILSRPSVSVSIKAYRSKRVEVLGEVRKPGSLPLEPGMTLLRAISQAGGFNSLANKGRVTVRRKVRGGKTVVATIDVNSIIDNTIADIPLQAGDAIIVGQRVF